MHGAQQFMVSASSSSRPSYAHLPDVPGPRGHWLLGHAPAMSRDSLATFTSNHQTFGDVSRVPMLGLGKFGARFDMHLISHPDDIAYVLDQNADNYPNAGMLRSRYVTLFGPSILSAEGEDWRTRRKLETPAFKRTRLNSIADRIIEEADITAARWEKRRINGNAPFDVVPEIRDLTLRVAGRMLIGNNFGEALSTMEEGYDIAARDMNMVWLHENTRIIKRIPSFRRRRFRIAKERIENALIKFVRERRAKLAAGQAENDLLDTLINARDAEGIGWTDRDIACELNAAARAGQDTTTASVVWAMLMIARHPEIEAQMLDEMREVIGDRPPQSADLPKMPFLKAIYDESVRLYPPIPTVARTATQEDAIGGFRIPPNACVVLLPWLTHRDPRWWNEPLKFKPERFLGAKPERSKYTYFPFGGGNRFCLGAGLALLQGPMILAALAQRYRLCVAADYEIRPRATITTMPDGGLPITLERR